MSALISTLVAVCGALLMLAFFSLDVFTYSVGPPEIVDSHDLAQIDGTAFAMGNRVLVFSEQAAFTISHPGYRSEDVEFLKTSNSRATHVELTPLPGYITVLVTDEFAVSIAINGIPRQPLEEIELAKGMHVVALLRGETELTSKRIEIEGFGQKQTIGFDLANYQSFLSVATDPAWAIIELNGVQVGRGRFQGGVPTGPGEVRISNPGYEPVTIPISSVVPQDFQLGTIELTPSPVSLEITTNPKHASILLDGEFAGESDMSITLQPRSTYELVVKKPGYREHRAVIQPEIGKNIPLLIDFEQETIAIAASVQPTGTLYVNGILKGEAPQTLTVYSGDTIEARAEGLKTRSHTVDHREGREQSLTFELFTPPMHAFRFAADKVTPTDGIDLLKFPPFEFQKLIDLDTREVITIEMKRPFYLSTTEVTNEAYKRFRPSTSGASKEPVTGVTWADAVRFCNWLSKEANLEPFYTVTPHGIVSSVNRDSLGYRLPTEREWEAGASYDWKAKRVLEPFEWGSAQVAPLEYANLAGNELVGSGAKFLESFTDNHVSLAPVASYKPNFNGLYDLTGNVVEWVHDYYVAVRETRALPDYLGPRTGFVNVVKGSSFQTDELDKVAIHHRDFELGKRANIGFRVARWIY
ncbi:MAG: SUMF1/EgtB/PvdO family nonheme iron enzyme [Gammaproteobacteria bacterium]|nr:SUMF1/EgtB/PvdO family nonheme iron enzyme [Gammaproteobacteria bacterium]